MMGEDAGDGLVDFREPDGASVKDLLDGEVESAVAGEQRPDSQMAVAWFVAGYWHEELRRVSDPRLSSARGLDAGLVTWQVRDPSPISARRALRQRVA